MSGVPVSEATAKDFIMVRAALVKRLGGANEALVWARVHYRCDEDSRVAHDTGSGRWWAASYELVGSEVGLTPKQARNALEKLVDDGFLAREQHALRNNYDRVYSYRPVVLPGITDVPEWADGSAQQGTPHLPSGANHHLPSGADVPSSKRQEDVTTKNVEHARPVTLGQRFAQPLCDVLRGELSRNDVKLAAATSKRWLDDARLLVDSDERDPREAKALIEWACRDAFWRSNILSMTSFRKQYDRLRLAREAKGGKASTVQHGRDVDAILRERESQQLAVNA